MKNPLLDKELLAKLDSDRNQIKYARITALTQDEDPVEQIAGKITGGSISIDGTSSLRRTCSLTMIAEDVNLTEYYWGIKTKFELEIGLRYEDDIIWFPQGIFVINSFNTSYSTSNFTINISGQDKMCLLNGTIGGTLPASIDFGQEESYDTKYTLIQFDSKTDFKANQYYYLDNEGNYIKAQNEFGFDNDGNYLVSKDQKEEDVLYYEKFTNKILTKIPLKRIILEAVHTYANEHYYNIIINDLDETGLELLEYRGEEPIYFVYDESGTICENIVSLYQSFLVSNPNWPPPETGYTGMALTLDSFPDSYFWTPSELLDGKGGELFSVGGTVIEKIVKSEDVPPYYDTIQEFKNLLGKSEEKDYSLTSGKTDIKIWGLEQGDELKAKLYSGDTVYYTIDSTGELAIDGAYLLTFANKTYDKYYSDISSTKKNIHLSYNTLVKESTGGKKVKIVKCTYGDTVGYRITDLVYTGELITSVGETLTNGVLDKIIDMLGDYQYYYNTKGQFVFEKKATYLNISWNSLVNTKDDIYAENAAQASEVVYNFEGNSLVSSVNHNPQLTNIKNDFSVFGERKGISDDTIPIHMRLAIDEKPNFYRSFDGIVYYTEEGQNKRPDAGYKEKILCDWREIIYQMALDFYAHNQEEEYLVDICDNNKYYEGYSEKLISPFPIGLTGYEQYYIDMQGFWRELYNPDPEVNYEYKGGLYEEVKVPLEDSNKKDAYVVEKKWVPLTKDNSSYTCEYYRPKSEQEKGQPDEYFTDNPDLYYWNIKIFSAPETLNFWIDFIDTEGELGQYSVKAIGDRTKTVNDKDVNSIYYKSVPNVIFFESMDEYNDYETKTGYLYVIMPNSMINQFTISTQGKSAKDAIDTLLYTHTYAAETISLSTIPIYYLEPNNRIYVYDENSHINDEYIINRINIPLTLTSVMSIEGAKAPKRLY